MAVSPIRAPAGVRRALNGTLWHRYDRTPITSSDVDGSEVSVLETTVSGVVCRYEAQGVTTRDVRGAVTISGPTLTVAYGDPLAVGDQVANIRTSGGEVLIVGPLTVQRRLDSADLGVTLQPIWELFGADPGRSA